jgi:hypothetical protein
MNDRILPEGVDDEVFRPASLEKWKVGKEITRENFASFIGQSFTLSRGQANVQGLMIKHLVDYGFLSDSSLLSDFTNELTAEEEQILYDHYLNSRGAEHRMYDQDIFLWWFKKSVSGAQTRSKEPIMTWYMIARTLYRKNVRHALRNAFIIKSKLKERSPIN